MIFTFAILLLPLAADAGGFYQLNHTQYGTSGNQGFKIVLYKEVMVNGMPQWQAQTEQFHVLTFSDPQWQIWIYEIGMNYFPAGGEFANALVEVWDVDNNYLIGSEEPVWVP